jgi:phospholipid transport system substrate-binding protein
VATPVGKFIQSLGDEVISILANKNSRRISVPTNSARFCKPLSTCRPSAAFVIGRSWNAATPAQQQEYMHLFEELMIKTYGDRMALYTGEGFQVTGMRAESEKDFIVASEITHPDGSEPTEVDWRVRKKEGKLGIIDVVVEGVSISVTQRQEYASIIQRDGGKLDGLLALMRQQLQEPGTANNQPG